jgi:hypothetical protein
LSEAGEGTLSREMRESKRLLEAELKVPVRAITYPYGRCHDCGPAVVREAVSAGYEFGATAMYGWNGPETGRMELRRIGIESSDTVFTLRAKLNGALDMLVLAESRAARRLVRLLNRITGS